MFNILKKSPEPSTSWEDFTQKEEFINGELFITINKSSAVEDLNRSIADFMKCNGFIHKYKVTISKIKEE